MISNLLGDRNGRLVVQMRGSTFDAIFNCSFFSMISNIFKGILFPFHSALICLFCNDTQNKSECQISFQVSLFPQHASFSRRFAFKSLICWAECFYSRYLSLSMIIRSTRCVANDNEAGQWWSVTEETYLLTRLDSNRHLTLFFSLTAIQDNQSNLLPLSLSAYCFHSEANSSPSLTMINLPSIRMEEQPSE